MPPPFMFPPPFMMPPFMFGESFTLFCFYKVCVKSSGLRTQRRFVVIVGVPVTREAAKSVCI